MSCSFFPVNIAVNVVGKMAVIVPRSQYVLFALDCFVLLILKILRSSSQIFFNFRGFSTGYGKIVCSSRKSLFVHTLLSSLSQYSEILQTLAKRPHITRLCSNFLSVFQDHVRSHGVSNHGWISFVKRYQSGKKTSIIAMVKWTLMHCSLQSMEVNKAGFYDASCRLAPSNSQIIWTHKVQYWPSTMHW